MKNIHAKILCLAVLSFLGLMVVGCADKEEQQNLDRMNQAMKQQREGMKGQPNTAPQPGK